MSSSEQEALDFLHEFELLIQKNIKQQGLPESEVSMAILEAQWELLHNILISNNVHAMSRKNNRKPRQKQTPA